MPRVQVLKRRLVLSIRCMVNFETVTFYPIVAILGNFLPPHPTPQEKTAFRVIISFVAVDFLFDTSNQLEAL